MALRSSPETDALFEAILTLRDIDECRTFLIDLLTVREMKDMARRLQVARLLSQGENYNAISHVTGASSATISRVSHCLAAEESGYRLVLTRLTTP